MSLGLVSRLDEEAVELLCEILRIDTSNPPGRETPLCERLADYLRDAGLEPRIIEPEPGRGSVVARLEGDGSQRPLLLSAHLDVVPADPTEWTHPPFGGEIHDGRIYGRGAVDMKAMVAMSAVVIKALAQEGAPRRRDVIFAGIADEEAGGALGSAHLVEHHPELVDAEYGLTEVGGFTMPLGDRTLMPVQVAEKGMERVLLRVRGQPGHGSMPHGDNAVVKLARIVNRFAKPLRFRAKPEVRQFLRAMGRAQGGGAFILSRLLTTRPLGPWLAPLVPEERRQAVMAMLHDLATPTMLQAGLGPNVIPGEATCRLDARYLPGLSRDELLALVRERAGPEAEVEGLGGLPPLSMPYPTSLWDTIVRVIGDEIPGAEVVPYLMPGFTDAKHYAKLGMTVYGFAPVALEPGEPFATLYHAPDERISVAGFKKGLTWLHRVVREFVS